MVLYSVITRIIHPILRLGTRGILKLHLPIPADLSIMETSRHIRDLFLRIRLLFRLIKQRDSCLHSTSWRVRNLIYVS